MEYLNSLKVHGFCKVIEVIEVIAVIASGQFSHPALLLAPSSLQCLF
jgi:hypothetical protein